MASSPFLIGFNYGTAFAFEMSVKMSPLQFSFSRAGLLLSFLSSVVFNFSGLSVFAGDRDSKPAAAVNTKALCGGELRALNPNFVVKEGLGDKGTITKVEISKTASFFRMKSWAYAVNNATLFRPLHLGDHPSPDDFNLHQFHPALVIDMNRRNAPVRDPLIIFDFESLVSVATLPPSEALLERRGDRHPIVVLYSDISGIPVQEIPEKLKDFLTSLVTNRRNENLELNRPESEDAKRLFRVIRKRSDLQANEGGPSLDRIADQKKIVFVQHADSSQIQIIIPSSKDIEIPDAPFIRRAGALRWSKNMKNGPTNHQPSAMNRGEDSSAASRASAGTTFIVDDKVQRELQQTMGPFFVAIPQEDLATNRSASTNANRSSGGASNRAGGASANHSNRMPYSEKVKAPDGGLAKSPEEKLALRFDDEASLKAYLQKLRDEFFDPLTLSSNQDTENWALVDEATKALAVTHDGLIARMARDLRDDSGLLSDLLENLDSLKSLPVRLQQFKDLMRAMHLADALGIPKSDENKKEKKNTAKELFNPAVVLGKSGLSLADARDAIFRQFYEVDDFTEDKSKRLTDHVIFHAGVLEDMKSFQIPSQKLKTIGDRIEHLARVAKDNIASVHAGANKTTVGQIWFVITSGFRVFYRSRGREQLEIIGLASHGAADGMDTILSRRIRELDAHKTN